MHNCFQQAEFRHIYEAFLYYSQPLFDMRMDLYRNAQYIYHIDSGNVERFLPEEYQKIDDELIKNIDTIKSLFFKTYKSNYEIRSIL